MNTKILSVVVLVAIIAGGIYWWNSTEPQRRARPNPNYIAPETGVADEKEVRMMAEPTGNVPSTTPMQNVNPKEVERRAQLQ